MTVYKLRKSFTVSLDDGASLDIQFDGRIVAFWWEVHSDLDADAESFQVEVSFLSSNALSSNDSRGSLTVAGAQASGTPGFIESSVNSGLSGLDIPVTRGERIHMHAILTGSGSVVATCYLYVDDRADPRIRRRR